MLPPWFRTKMHEELLRHLKLREQRCERAGSSTFLITFFCLNLGSTLKTDSVHMKTRRLVPWSPWSHQSCSSVSALFILMKPLCGWASKAARILLVKMKKLLAGFGKPLQVFANRWLFGFSKESQWFRHPDSNFLKHGNLNPYILPTFCNGTLLYFITGLSPANWFQLGPHWGGETCSLSFL